MVRPVRTRFSRQLPLSPTPLPLYSAGFGLATVRALPRFGWGSSTFVLWRPAGWYQQVGLRPSYGRQRAAGRDYSIFCVNPRAATVGKFRGGSTAGSGSIVNVRFSNLSARLG